MSEQQAAKKEHEARAAKLYEFDASKGQIKLRNKKCPRCGNFMARHKNPVDRWTCGSCSYTDYVEKKGPA
jgi:small subunit ribosomal protein S27Ae